MNGTDFLPIADFSESAGVSKQAVYRRLRKDLAPYCKEIDGKKCILASAIELFNPQQRISATDNSRAEYHNGGSMNYLLSQLTEKDRLIQEQQATIKAQAKQIQGLQQHIIEQSKVTTDILFKQSHLQENFQILLGKQQKQIESVSDHSSVAESNAESLEPPAEGLESECNTDESTQKTRFFQRFFG